MPPAKSQQCMPMPAPTCPSADRRRRAAPSSAAATSAASGAGPLHDVDDARAVALADHRDDHVVDADRAAGARPSTCVAAW